MSDDMDNANAMMDKQLDDVMARRRPFTLDAGKPGECDFCGEWFGRIVDGACVPCRDKHERRQKNA